MDRRTELPHLERMKRRMKLKKF